MEAHRDTIMLTRLVVAILFALLYASTVIHANSKEFPKVKTPAGKLKGYYKETKNGRRYEAYEGIPYAVPPVRELRFESPRRIPTWIGELSATKFGSPCLQYAIVPRDLEDKVEGAEDCLYLNVYTPVRTKNNDSLPVLFWIHSGAFQSGSGITTGAMYLLDRNVVFVTINYRLGALGFLSTEDEVVPGNMGLKDQNLALQWVSENIESFGGDPKRVTLVGTSAGGASVQYHYLSKMSAGLFQGGMSISGTAFNSWAQTENSLEKTKKLSALMGCPTNSSKEIIQCLRNRPARAIGEAMAEFKDFPQCCPIIPYVPFGPVVEKVSKDSFIDKTLVEIMNSGEIQDLPWINGVTDEEALFVIEDVIKNGECLTQLKDKWDSVMPSILDFSYTIPKEKHAEIVRRIKQFYLGDKPINKENIHLLVSIASDRLIIADSAKASRMQAKVNRNSVWFYYYTYISENSLSSALSDTNVKYGANHCDNALFIEKPLTNSTRREDYDMLQIEIDFWISFAENKFPKVTGVEWTKLDPAKEELHYLHMASPNEIYMDSGGVNFGNKDLWNSINFDENKLEPSSAGRKDEL